MAIITVVLIASALVFINIRKNEISRELLKEINREFAGEFTVEGVRIGNLLSYPVLDVSLSGVRFWDSKEPSERRRNLIIDVDGMRFNADLDDIRNRRILISKLVLNRARLILERDSKGEQIITKAFSKSAEATEGKDSSQLMVQIQDIEIMEAELTVIDNSSGIYIPMEIEWLEGDLNYDGSLVHGRARGVIDPEKLMDTLDLTTDPFKIELDASYGIDLKGRKLSVKGPLTLFDELKFSMDLNMDYMDEENLVMNLNSAEGGLDLERIFQPKLASDTLDVEEEKTKMGLEGRVRLDSKLEWKPQKGLPWQEAMSAERSIEGDDLDFKGADLDEFIQKFRQSQNFNLADVGAVMFAGPAGLAITKGRDFASLAFARIGDSTHVSKFLARWRFSHGRILAQDVAMSTRKNRIAVDGAYKVWNDSLRFNIRVIDRKGCELVGQRIYGTFDDLKFGKVNIIKTFLGPVKNFFVDLGLVKCDRVYQGRVPHPEPVRERN